MIRLPGFLIVLALVRTYSAVDLEPASTSDEPAGQSPKCPGMCQEAVSCTTSLAETDCSDGLVCCVDHLEKITASEFDDGVAFTTESLLDSNVVHEVEEEGSELSEEFSTEPDLFEMDSSQVEVVKDEVSPDIELMNSGRYEVVYSEESGEAMLAPVEEMEQDESDGGCPGSCVSLEVAGDCPYIVRDSEACSPEAVCCLSEEDVQRTSYVYDYEEEKPSGFVKRSTEQKSNLYDCPGTCVHPSQTGYCNLELPEYTCPLNTKCCSQASVPMPQFEKIDCTGICMPFHMDGYCLPPNELVIGQTTCEPGTTCCMRNPSNIRPPIAHPRSFPSLPMTSPTNFERAAHVLGHLAVDDAGTVFRVSRNGQVSPLPILPPRSNLKDFNREGSYTRFDGDIAIFSDLNGLLYQQFYPRQSSATGFQGKRQTPLIRQPISQFESQASEHSASFQTSPSDQNKLTETQNGDATSDIVIPDDDDEAPVTTNRPVSHSDKSSSPPCPGSCMSYFLRFTCFRGYATYDGFTCPGRSVCCARLKDIEDHEQYLKSLSPYFNVPPASRDSTFPRCGIKGRRDTPRIMGGKDSLPGEWCWQVAVINVQNQYMCGGAIIDNSWVLTAAHCVVGSFQENLALFVRAGVTDLKSPEDNSKAQTVRVLSTFIHHNFNSRNLDNNIALLRLQKPLTLGSGACVICLPTTRKMPQEGAKCTVTGYGFISPDGEMSLRVREAQVPLIDDMECMTNVTEALDNPFLLPLSSFCAGGEGIEDACQGDAGGALACEAGGFHELVGLVSWGLGCGRDYVPSIYIKVPAFMGWINQIISSNSFLDSLQ